jgi:hypothetical protein
MLNRTGLEIKPKSPRHKAALAYAETGIPIFPCKPNEKIPATSNGFHDATTDPAQIDAWWTEADYNVAFEPETAGLCVVDVDPDGKKAWEEFCNRENIGLDTRTVSTPRGGSHYYFEGSLVGSVRRLVKGAAIDTRGRGSYVLVPPSAVDGKPYRMIREAECAQIPGAIALALAKTAAPVREAPEGFEPDQPAAIERARTFLRNLVSRGDIAIEGSGGDAKTYQIACRLFELGVSSNAAYELLLEEWYPHCAPCDNPDFVQQKVDHAFKYMQNARGVWANPPAETAFGPAIGKLADKPADDGAPDEDEVAFRRRVAFFRGQEPDEDEALPELEFWDAEKTLPKSGDGAVVIAYGPSGDFKTAMCVADALDAIARGAKVVFAEGEGTHGFRKHRLPAACRARGITTSSLRGKWRTCPAVPLLTDATDVRAFKAAHGNFHPDIVYLDTMAAASGDTEENSAAFGQLLTSTGPVGRICRELRCTVVVIHHSGKDVSKGARGHSSMPAAADGVYFITADKDARTADKFIQKMRDAPDGFSIGYKVTPAEQTPVLTKTGRLDRHSGVKLTAAQLADLRVTEIGEQLRDFGAVGETKALTYRQFAELRCGRPRPLDTKEFNKWTIEVELDEADLRNWTARAAAESKRKKTPNPFARYCRRVVWPGSEKSILAWFAPGE